MSRSGSAGTAVALATVAVETASAPMSISRRLSWACVFIAGSGFQDAFREKVPRREGIVSRRDWAVNARGRSWAWQTPDNTPVAASVILEIVRFAAKRRIAQGIYDVISNQTSVGASRYIRVRRAVIPGRG